MLTFKNHGRSWVFVFRDGVQIGGIYKKIRRKKVLWFEAWHDGEMLLKAFTLIDAAKAWDPSYKG